MELLLLFDVIMLMNTNYTVDIVEMHSLDDIWLCIWSLLYGLMFVNLCMTLSICNDPLTNSI